MTPAVIVVDMLCDNIHGAHAGPARDAALAVVPAINRILDAAHERRWPVIFACDSFLPDDFIFHGRMKPHALRGTPGADPIPELHRAPDDTVLPKRRFSAFFKTDLGQTLRLLAVDTVLVAGISTHFCVLATALDAVANDFQTVLVEDACAAARPEWHAATLATYRNNVLRPLLRVQPVATVLEDAGPFSPPT
ncbi:MAG: cysteine hydrolase [Deltaproteobacteria bacterium]|nr:cysteine hydrolase [Deltaproteobacteria bacterium]